MQIQLHNLYYNGLDPAVSSSNAESARLEVKSEMLGKKGQHKYIGLHVM